MNFGYRETIDKQKDLVSVQRKVVSKSLVGVLKVFLYLLVLLIITVGFLGLGLLHGIIKSAPSVDDISITPSASATTVYDSNNKKISTLVTSGSNRIKISLDQVPDHLKWAFIDTEDSRFYEHNGIDVQGIGRAAFIALTTMNPSEGASTLTQQVLKNNVFTNWTNESSFLASFKRKIQEQALEIVEKTKKQYWDARHNCFAFVIGKNNEVQRFSDDGEPQGTAGKPILEVLTKGNIHNTLIIVTRYFGGTLLGTGGLVRAYGQSSKAAIENSRLLRVCEGVSFSVECDYNSIGKIKYIIAQMNIEAKEEYGANVKLDIEMPKENFEKFKSQVVEATNGQAVFSRVDDIEYKQKCTD